MTQIDGAGQEDTDNEDAEALQAALAQRQVTLQGQPQGGSDVPSHQNSDPVSDESEILGSVSLLPENVVYRVPPERSSATWSGFRNPTRLSCCATATTPCCAAPSSIWAARACSTPAAAFLITGRIRANTIPGRYCSARIRAATAPLPSWPRRFSR